MEYWKLMDTDDLFIADLRQHREGIRSVSIRKPGDSRDMEAVLSTREYPGRTLREALWGRSNLLKEICLENGAHFVIDAHNSWMTYEELAHYRRLGDRAFDIPGPPWINGIPPQLPDK
jgi:hypothetical protein